MEKKKPKRNTRSKKRFKASLLNKNENPSFSLLKKTKSESNLQLPLSSRPTTHSITWMQTFLSTKNIPFGRNLVKDHPLNYNKTKSSNSTRPKFQHRAKMSQTKWSSLLRRHLKDDDSANKVITPQLNSQGRITIDLELPQLPAKPKNQVFLKTPLSSSRPQTFQMPRHTEFSNSAFNFGGIPQTTKPKVTLDDFNEYVQYKSKVPFK